MLKCPLLAWMHDGNIGDTHQVHDVDRRTEAVLDEGLAWLGTKCHRRRNGRVTQTSLGIIMFMPKKRILSN